MADFPDLGVGGGPPESGVPYRPLLAGTKREMPTGGPGLRNAKIEKKGGLWARFSRGTFSGGSRFRIPRGIGKKLAGICQKSTSATLKIQKSSAF